MGSGGCPNGRPHRRSTRARYQKAAVVGAKIDGGEHRRGIAATVTPLTVLATSLLARIAGVHDPEASETLFCLFITLLWVILTQRLPWAR